MRVACMPVAGEAVPDWLIDSAHGRLLRHHDAAARDNPALSIDSGSIPDAAGSPVYEAFSPDERAGLGLGSGIHSLPRQHRSSATALVSALRIVNL